MELLHAFRASFMYSIQDKDLFNKTSVELYDMSSAGQLDSFLSAIRTFVKVAVGFSISKGISMK